MRLLLDAIVTITLLWGLNYGSQKVYATVKKAALEKVKEGLYPMEPFAQKMTGYKLPF